MMPWLPIIVLFFAFRRSWALLSTIWGRCPKASWRSQTIPVEIEGVFAQWWTIIVRNRFWRTSPSSIYESYATWLEAKFTGEWSNSTLDNMVQFAQRNRALQSVPTRHSAGITACVQITVPVPAQLQSPSPSSATSAATPPQFGVNFSKMEEWFTSVAEGQAALIAALPEATPKVRPAAGSRFRSPDSATYFRSRQPGHFAWNCTSSSPRRRPAWPGFPSSLHNPQCSLCFGWGHFVAECVNNRNSSTRTASYPQGRIFSNNSFNS